MNIILQNILLLPILTSSASASNDAHRTKSLANNDDCQIFVTMSIPENLTYPEPIVSHLSTYDSWMMLLDKAEQSVDMAAMYWTLRSKDITPSDPTAKMGDDVFKKIVATAETGKSFRIAQNIPGRMGSADSDYLKTRGLAQVQSLNMTRIMGGGVLHTKMWLVDKKHFYLGSANMDWRSLIQIKEMGMSGFNCPALTTDLSRIWATYWYMSQPNNPPLPKPWPDSYTTQFNHSHPMAIKLNGTMSRVYFSSSPPPMRGNNRENDIDAIVKIINEAQQFVHIAVMDYLPLANFYSASYTYWPVIDDALRSAAVDRGVDVKLLVSKWDHTKFETNGYMISLMAVGATLQYKRRGSIQVKFFKVPANERQRQIPYARVNHNKYMATEKAAYVGTSNWIGDYFINTAGIGMIVRPSLADNEPNTTNHVINTVQRIFEQDWNSPFAYQILRN